MSLEIKTDLASRQDQLLSTNIVFTELWNCLKHHWESDVFCSFWKVIKIYKKYSVSIFFVELFLYHFIHTKLSEFWEIKFDVWNIHVSFSVLPLDITSIWLVQDIYTKQIYTCSTIPFIWWLTLYDLIDNIELKNVNNISRIIAENLAERSWLDFWGLFNFLFTQINPINVKVLWYSEANWTINLNLLITDLSVSIKWFLFDNLWTIINLIWENELNSIINNIDTNYGSIKWVSDNIKLFFERIK